MGENTQLIPADFAAILSTTLALAAEVGVQVGIRNAPEKEHRPAGILIYISGIEADADGRLGALENIEEVATAAEP